MKRIMILIFIALAGMILLSSSTSSSAETPVLQSSIQQVPDYGSTPLYFIPNKGQVHEKAGFYAKTPGYTLWMTKEGLVFDSVRKIGKKTKRDVSRLLFLDANKNPVMTPVETAQYKVNYLKGKNPSQWKTNIGTSKAVLYKNLYKNVDLKVYGIAKKIEYDWMVKPGGDPAAIRFQYKNVKDSHIDENGNILIETELGTLTHKCPFSFQYRGTDGADRAEVKATFKKIGKNTYGFNVGVYDKSRELIIDPVVMAYSTYLGGSGDEHAFGLAVNSSGQAFVTGDTYSTNFPTDDAYQGTFGGGDMDAFVTKFSTSGTSLVYSTYLGGSGDDAGEGIQLDSSGKAYVVGLTSSTDFPTHGAYQSANGGGRDVFVAVLSSSGGSLTYATYLGGSGKDEGFALALDGSKNIYITGRAGSTDFPTQNAYKDTFSGSGSNEYDAFVTKINSSGTSLGFSTYLGGSLLETGYGIAVDGSNAYVGGRTTSTNFPTTNEYQSTHGGGTYDAFVTKFSSSGSSLIYSTYLGGSGIDSGYGIAVYGSGNAYVTGDTQSSNFPILNAYQSSRGGAKDAFVTKFATAGTTLEYSTFLGGGETDTAAHIMVNDSGNAYITGSTMSSDYPVSRAYQNTFSGDFDVFVSMLSTSGSGLSFSSFLGGGGYESGRGVAFDGSGNIYVAGYTESSDFPTQSAFQNSHGGGDKDAFVSKFSTEEFGTLCGGVDNCNLTWTTGGDADWFEQTDVYYNDGDAVRSGDIGNSQSSYIETTVTGPGLLTFYWKVSSDYSDYLRFYIDGIVQASIYGGYGTTSWAQQSYTISQGSHTLRWSYEKSSYWEYASDCGWVDYVQFSPLPEITTDRTQMTFGAVPGTVTGSQTFSLSSSTEGVLDWSLTTDQTWLTCSPTSGTGNGVVTVSVDTTGLAVGTHTANISIADTNAANSPLTIPVTLNVYSPGGSGVPFGSYATPTDGSTISSSVPFTGWVLDDMGVENVKLYRHSGGSLLYIGDAIFVEGARPDVEQAYPDYPFNYKAGWGYMMLTNFLPNGGNGTFTIEAIATDLEGHQASLGTKTVTVNNADAVKPFGAIDTPTQGGSSSGTDYRNQGWVLTPLPNTVPTDGSTIDVYIDGVKLGNPTYNLYRSDIATLFPGYNNSGGAHAYFDFDTTAYADGVHTIQWVATDDASNADGIGSRYFMVQNSGNREQAAGTGRGNPVWLPGPENMGNIPVDNYNPVEIKTGYNRYAESQRIYPDDRGITRLEIRELERVEMRLSPGVVGYHVVGDQLKALPVGSTLDTFRGIFYWQPGAGFTGQYRFVFIEKDKNGNSLRRDMSITINPRF
ncbi:MAG: hypothetical protein GY950_08955 [bacterium]|nr:hypothetical protein [bacterium]